MMSVADVDCFAEVSFCERPNKSEGDIFLEAHAAGCSLCDQCVRHLIPTDTTIARNRLTRNKGVVAYGGSAGPINRHRVITSGFATAAGNWGRDNQPCLPNR
jgi:hypothetical protein